MAMSCITKRTGGCQNQKETLGTAGSNEALLNIITVSEGWRDIPRRFLLEMLSRWRRKRQS